MSTPANQLPAPILDPSQYPAYADVQRKQMLAQMLMQSLQNSQNSPNPSTGSTNNPYYVTPRRSALQNIAPLVTALMAGKASKDANTAQQQYFQGLYGGGNQQSGAASGSTPPSTGPGAGIISPDASPDAQAGAQAVTDSPPAPKAGLVAPAASAAPPRNPLIPPGMTPGAAQQMLNLMGPEAYAKNFLAQTPEWQNALRANNGDVNAAMAQMHAQGVKAGAIDIRGGGTVAIPDPSAAGGYRMVRAPNLGVGQEATYDASGNVTGVRNIPGAVAAGADTKGAETAAEVSNTPRMVPMGGGSERLMYPGDPNGPGLPPALRQQGAPSAPQPSANAPSTANGSQPPTGGAGAPVSKASPAAPAIPQKDSSGILSNNLWPNIPTMQIPSTPGQTTNAYQQKIIDSAAAKHQELVNKFGDQSAAGVQQLEYLTAAEKSLPNAEVGPMSDWLTHNRGVLVQQFPQLAGALGGDKVTPTLELNKQLTNAALQGARTTFGSRMTQNEVQLQTDEMSPSAGMTRDALVSLINQAKMKAAYGIQQDKDYSDYHAQNGDPNRFESQYNVMRPITRFSAQYNTPAPALDRLKANPALLPDFRTKYGWDPTR